MLPIDPGVWRAEWGLWAASGGFAAVLLLRGRPDRALGLVLLSCAAWSVWSLPIHKEAGAVVLAPLVVGTAVILWSQPGHGRPVNRRCPPRGWDKATVRMDSSLVWVLSVITVGGVWLAVPETAVNVVIIMAVIPVAAVAWWDADHPPWTVKLGILALVALGSISGAGGRTAWIGGFACAGLIPFNRKDVPWWLVLSVHWLVVLGASRVVSRWEFIPTVLGSLGLVGGGWMVVAFSSRLRGQREP